MSFADRAILWLHIAAAVFTIGPGTAAIMATPRSIRNKNTAVLRFLNRTTLIYSVGALLVLVFGLILAGLEHLFSAWWISVSTTLFVVAVVLLLLVLRDQRKALTVLTQAEEAAVAGAVATDRSVNAGEAPKETAVADGGQPVSAAAPGSLRIAAVERGRIASIGGVTALIWLVILVLMVWK